MKIIGLPVVARWGQGIALTFILFIFVLSNSAAAITTLSQGYTTSDQVSSGSIVSLKEGLQDQVVAANPASTGTILGVVISDNSSLLSLWSGQAAQQVQVATSGIVQVLVSDINGEIEDGDQITASPISGVGMRATSNTKVVGVAQGSQDNNNSSEQSYKDKDGETHKVKLGLVPTLINVSYFYKQPEKTLIPSAVQNIANALAGKKVDSLPILISMGIFLVTLIVVASVLYAMIRSSIISVGRNPMSQAAIYRQLTQMSALVVGIIAAATISIYMILTRF